MDQILSVAAREVESGEEAGTAHGRPDTTTLRRCVVLALPLLGATGLMAVFAGRFGQDPSLIPYALHGKPVPEFDLPPVLGRTAALSSADLRGQVSLLNVFASWCVACREEHSFLMRLAASKTVAINGLNYKDAPDAQRWLDANGDPYARTRADITGRVAIDWGVYGVPETYVIDAAGGIAHKVIGPLNAEIYQQAIEPVLLRLTAGPVAPRGAIG
jgi:cytochrome c biogenesis protein CcmG/thiol:disulfide interchange protein DsbE